MSLIVSRNAANSFIGEDFNKPRQDPTSFFSEELVLQIFSHFNLATLGTICCVSKEWKRLANESTLWKSAIYREIAFGNDKWAQCFGKDVVKDEDNREEFSSLPCQEFIEDCKKFKNIFPEKKAKDTLMLVRLPKTLNGQLTLKSLGELAKKYFSNSDTGYRIISSTLVDELGDKSIDKSRWVLMTKDVLPGSSGKNYTYQQKIVDELAEQSLISYEVPETLESAACILSQYFGSKTRLFSNNPWTYTRCKEKVQGDQTVVGGFGPDGLIVNAREFEIGTRRMGVAALRKF